MQSQDEFFSPIPLPYIFGSESRKLRKTGQLIGDDMTFLALSYLRSSIQKNPDQALNIIDTFAARFGILDVPIITAQAVKRDCKFACSSLALQSPTIESVLQ
jgi:hypothetical protein